MPARSVGLLLGTFFARVRIHVPLLGIVIGLGAVSICGVAWGDVGAIFRGVTAHVVAT